MPVSPNTLDWNLVAADVNDMSETWFEKVTLRRRGEGLERSPLPPVSDVAAAFAEQRFPNPMERDGCELGYLVGYATVSHKWRSGDPLPDPWADGSYREFALSLDGMRGVRWLDAYERGFKKGAIDKARQVSAEYPPEAAL